VSHPSSMNRYVPIRIVRPYDFVHCNSYILYDVGYKFVYLNPYNFNVILTNSLFYSSTRYVPIRIVRPYDFVRCNLYILYDVGYKFVYLNWYNFNVILTNSLFYSST
jgi:hypothetical protein